MEAQGRLHWIEIDRGDGSLCGAVPEPELWA